jgi:hypothetical protein
MGLKSIGVLDVISKDAMSRLGMDRELEMLEEAERNAMKNKPPPKEGEGLSENLMEQAGGTETRVAGELAE